ncbi:MAG: hypothetical protein JSS09_02805, partial [Verrucomicrobia bacterium]|nr:hypothetical protein [Verrucomicrobiota bacterium]
ISPPFPSWVDYLSSQEEEKHKQNTVFWKTTQSATIVALCALGVGILLSPYVFPITYTNLLMNAFAFVPLILPIPSYFYNYCALQAAKASRTVEKILFFRSYHPLIENASDCLIESVKKTFETDLSDEKMSSLQKRSNLLTPILCHITFASNEIQSLEEQRKDLHESISFYKEKDFDSLLKNPLFSDWKDSILTAKKSWIQNKNNSDSLKFLDNLIKTLSNSPLKTSEALLELRRLYWKWRNKDSLSLEEKWTPLFILDEKILTAKINRLFLWTFLFRPIEELENSLSKHGLQIEDALYDFKTTKTSLTLQERSIAFLYQDPASERLLFLANDIITKQEIIDPKKREEALDKLLRSQNHQKKYYSVNDVIKAATAK